MAADDDLSDEQMEALLARATARLQSNANGAAQQSGDGKNKFNFPKLNAGELDKPYVSTKGDVATVDASRLLEEKQRRQADGPRKVEDPVMAKKLAVEVRLTAHSRSLLAMRKIIPIFS